MSTRSDGVVVSQDLAARILEIVEKEKVSIKSALSRFKLNQEIRSSVYAYSMETLKRLNAIDHVLKLSCPKFEKIDPYIKNVMRIAVYEMKYKGVHPALATDSAVRLAKKFKMEKLVNAVLRKAENVEIKSEDKIKNLSLEYFHPEWFIKYALDLLGDEALELMRANNEVLPTYVRVNELKSSVESVRRYLEEKKVQLRETFLDEVFEVLSYEKHPAALEWHSEGKYVIQDLVSCYVSVVLDPKPGETILDLAAAPGIKTSHIAALMQNEGKILALDISKERVEKMKTKLKILGVKNVEVKVADGCNFKFEAEKALVDAPCSSTGSISDYPNVKWSFDKRKFESTLKIQKKLLDNALKNACEVIYSTCSIMVEENEMQVKGKKIVKIDSPFSRGVEKFRGFVFEDWDKVLRSYPHRHRTSGFFIAKMKR
ncbi:MAG: RsmB/NOP family class I SAM-dependent RNA methyltransferase [Archaeoglobaceae archaeon]|nr:RsmB/NOP family class I SAM-dependent RNA methyltransferase [Archaeoglobaceae archaeon]MCX8152366.1 RsmB/NOP family class I SAM-dependent RNA methyltransferase [Archaeoglobaceae archaeon]MDW8014175.1 RsmB/NOP family class I SAM-dependent RNA methyltransferase [Archaeoglobaceae archaeon]